jgi:hypothetical protein
MNLLPVTCTVKPVLRGHLWDNEKVALQDRTIKRHSFNTGDCLIEVTTWAGLTVFFLFTVSSHPGIQVHTNIHTVSSHLGIQVHTNMHTVSSHLGIQVHKNNHHVSRISLH